MKLKRLGLVGIVAATLAMGYTGCSNNPVDPMDNPPTVQSFTAVPSSVKQGGSVTFNYSGADDNGLSFAVLKSGEGTPDTVRINGAKSYSGSMQKAYLTSGVKTAEIDFYDAKNQLGMKTVQVGVDAVPVFDKTQLDGIEGSAVGYAKKDIAHDPSGNKVTLTVVSSDPHVSIIDRNDSLIVSGKTVDDNGTYAVQMRADNGTAAVDKAVNVVLAQRDDLSLVVQDARKGTLADQFLPSMQPPYDVANSSVVIDGIPQVMDAQGNVKSSKLVPGTHVITLGLNDLKGNKSFGATYYLPAGDQSATLGVNTAVGTGQSPENLQRFMRTINFHNGTGHYKGIPNVFKSINFSYGKSYVFWISQKDTTRFSENYFAYTSAEQDTLETWLNDVLRFVPSENRPRIYKAKKDEPLPQSNGKALPGYFVILKRTAQSRSDALGLIEPQDNNQDGILDAATVSLYVPFDKSAALKECLSAMVAPNDLLDHDFKNLSIFHYSERPSFPTAMDIVHISNCWLFSKYISNQDYAKNGSFVTRDTFWKLR